MPPWTGAATIEAGSRTKNYIGHTAESIARVENKGRAKTIARARTPNQSPANAFVLHLPSAHCPMRRPFLIRLALRWSWAFLILVGLGILGVFVVNLVDYIPYQRAMARVEHLDEKALRAITDVCALREKAGHQRLFGKDIPQEFSALKPVRVSFYPGCTDIALWEPNDFAYVFLRVSTRPKNQVIEAVDADYRRQHSRTLWERNPEFTKSVNPSNRIVTLAIMGMNSSQEWILQPDALLCINRSYSSWQADEISARVVITPGQLAEFQNAILSLGSDIRGHAFDPGGADGVTFNVSFRSGGQGDDDIILARTWREELRPLVNAIVRTAGNEDTANLQQCVAWVTNEDHQFPATDYPLARYRHRLSDLPLAWWRIWPRFIHPQDNESSIKP